MYYEILVDGEKLDIENMSLVEYAVFMRDITPPPKSSSTTIHDDKNTVHNRGYTSS